MDKANKFVAVSVVASIMLMSTMYSNMVFVVVAELLLMLASMISIKINPKAFRKGPAIFIVLLFMYLLTVSVLSQTIQYNIITTLLLFSQIVFIMMIANSGKDKKILKYIYKYFARIMLVLATYAIIVYIFGDKIQIYNNTIGIYTQNWDCFGIVFSQSSLGGDQIGTINVGSILNNPNTLSYFSLMALYIIIFSRWKISKKILGALLLLAAIYISGSRLALMLACSLPLVMICGRVGLNSRVKKVVFAILVLLLTVVFMMNMGQIAENINFNGRLERWQIGIENISMFGHGLKSDELALKESLGHDVSMHNSYISVMDNFGLVLFVIFIIMLLWVIRDSIRKSKKEDYRTELVLLIIIMIASMSESVIMFVCGYNLLFFLILFSMINWNSQVKIGGR